jgi:hypothetical protein
VLKACNTSKDEHIMIKEILTSIATFLVGLLIPVLIILVGAGCIALAFHYEIALLGWFGLALAGAGVVWGFLLVAAHGGLD